MAKRKSAQKIINTDATVPDENRIETVLEDESQRLQKAASVLACLAFALVYARDRTDDEVNQMGSGDFADMADVACDLVRKTVRNLDAVIMTASAKKHPLA